MPERGDSVVLVLIPGNDICLFNMWRYTTGNVSGTNQNVETHYRGSGEPSLAEARLSKRVGNDDLQPSLSVGGNCGTSQ
jgi:hypothetical protein